ncbi:hypothetical protein E2562_024866 [Oryza meyeriana var. granulata]|uniref:DUF834 domain-containing protein n=1 Tax=Oryza meyeriana var. granulata TaxID=110450 RepID=A0A6G1CJN8_9ORYZ|nr:hypothetical protein E2562_024866 [Oryza meyeriana var. granulata]
MAWPQRQRAQCAEASSMARGRLGGGGRRQDEARAHRRWAQRETEETRSRGLGGGRLGRAGELGARGIGQRPVKGALAREGGDELVSIGEEVASARGRVAWRH